METAIYGRVSTEEQALEGYSIRGQVEKLKSYVSAKSWSIYDVYLDEGISGKNLTARPAITRMIEDIKAGHIKNVLIYKLDRLTRSVADLVYLIDLFKTYDCAFSSLSESIDTSTASGRMFVKIIGIFAEFERENIGERVRLEEARDVLRIDSADNDEQITALLAAIPSYLEITAGYVAAGEYSPLAKTAARFILQLWYYGENSDTDKLRRVIDSLLKALSYEKR